MQTYFKKSIEPLSKELDKLLNIKRIPVQYIETETGTVIALNEYRPGLNIYFYEPKTYDKAPF